jgi:hypothetical protein
LWGEERGEEDVLRKSPHERLAVVVFPETKETRRKFMAVDAFLVVLFCWARRIGVDVEPENPFYAEYARRLLRRE